MNEVINNVLLSLVITPLLFAGLFVMVAIGDRVKMHFRKQSAAKNAKRRFDYELHNGGSHHADK